MNHDDEATLPSGTKFVATNDDIVSAELIPEPAAPPVAAPTASATVQPATVQPANMQPAAVRQTPVELLHNVGREIGAMALMVMLCDLTIYRGHGYAGYAFLFVVAPLLLTLGANRRTYSRSLIVVVVLLAALVLKLIWCGSVLLVIFGFGFLAAVSMTLTGQCPYVLELAIFVSQTLRSGWEALLHYGRNCSRTSPMISSFPLINVVLPVIAFFVFSFIFVLANPDLLASLSDRLDFLTAELRAWLEHLSVFEIAFWLVTAWLSLGLLRPWTGALQSPFAPVEPESPKPAPAPLYTAFRNTLLTVIGLFAVYLVFEFVTLWFREFPAGFHYSGYAHEGAAWLTVALALATATLSLVFRGSVLHDPRLNQLRRLAWIWSTLNLLLALAVYNRLFIYIGFNGLTRMRMVGLFGISLVACGFILVILKIARDRDAIWLIRRHLWALALAVFLYTLTPIDTLVVRYNVSRILGGDEAPSVQMTVQSIGPEGDLGLLPLLNCENAIIREGIQAMLANRLDRAEERATQRAQFGWTTFQLADQRALQGLRAARKSWQQFDDPASREEVWDRFADYAYQWY